MKVIGSIYKDKVTKIFNRLKNKFYYVYVINFKNDQGEGDILSVWSFQEPTFYASSTDWVFDIRQYKKVKKVDNKKKTVTLNEVVTCKPIMTKEEFLKIEKEVKALQKEKLPYEDQ